MARPARHRVHAAGVVGRHRRPRPRVRPIGRPVLRRRADRRVAHRHLRRDRDAGVATGAATTAGELVDVSMLEALALCLTYYPVTYYDMVGRPIRKRAVVDTPGVEATSDGLVGARRAAPASSGSTSA